MTMMLHSPQVHGFFGVPADPLSSRPVLEAEVRNALSDQELTETIVVTPDMGHVKSAIRFADNLGLKVAAGNKQRLSDVKVEIGGLVGTPVEGYRRALVYDDEVATGGSVVKLAEMLIDRGIEEIWVTCTHGVFVRDGLQRLAEIPQITRIVTTDTVYIPADRRHEKLKIVSVARIFGEAIRRNYLQQSIGDLFIYGENGN
jgi:ribose-phosphate pyrophosphokinase